MPKQWNPGQHRKFARDIELGKTYYTVSEQSKHAATYGSAYTYSEHVFTGHSNFTGLPMTAGGSSSRAICDQGPVYDAPPSGVRPNAGPAPQLGAADFKAGGKARGWW